MTQDLNAAKSWKIWMEGEEKGVEELVSCQPY